MTRPLLTWLTGNDGRRRPMSPALARHVDTLGRGTADAPKRGES